VLRELTPDRTRHELARAATFYVVTKTGTKTVEPPTVVVADVLATPRPPLPAVTRLTGCPTFAPDGTLETGAGYRPASRTYCTDAVAGLPPVPEQPSAGDVARAVALFLDELLVDFPFVEQADRTNALAFGLLPYVRDLIRGPTPLHLFEAPAPGSGKGLLIEALLLPALGRSWGTFSQCRDDDEWRKRITAVLRDGAGAVLIDNITHPLDSGTLASALTATHWSDRLLGQNTTVRLPVRCAWAATANNPAYSTELARRTVPVRLDPKVDRPWEREGFRHERLLEWVGWHRASLVWAGLVLVRHWLAAGRPAQPGRALGSYEEWSAVLGGVLRAAGVEGFLGNIGRFYDAVDVETAAWRGFVGAWWERYQTAAVGVAGLAELARETDHLDLGAGNDRSQRVRFGKLLARQRDRVIGGYRVVDAGTKQRAAQWRLLDTTPPSDGVNVEDGDSTSPQRGSAGTVKVGEGSVPRSHASAGGAPPPAAVGTAGGDLHPPSPHSPPGTSAEAGPAPAPPRRRPAGSWPRKGPGLGGGFCADETHPVFVYTPEAGPNAGKPCHGCAVCWPEHPQAAAQLGAPA
jgi:putative DNA primase/helicase